MSQLPDSKSKDTSDDPTLVKLHNQEPSLENLNAFERAIVAFGDRLAVLFLISVIISVYEIISRFLFNSPTIWVHELTIFFCGICLAYGGLYCLIKNRHIRIDFIYDSLSNRSKYALDVFVETMQLIFFLALSYASWIMVQKSWFTPQGELRLETSGSTFSFPSPALIKAMILICVVLMAITSSMRLYKLLAKRGSN